MKNNVECPECDGKTKRIKIDSIVETDVDWCRGILSGQISSKELVHYAVYECRSCGYLFRVKIPTYD